MLLAFIISWFDYIANQQTCFEQDCAIADFNGQLFSFLQASLATWVTILRVMGDLPEADYGESIAVAGVSNK